MRYRLQIVASEHHRGRLRLVWDPAFTTATPEVNVQFTKIVDISSDKDIYLDIDWGQSLHYCTVPALTNASYRSGTPFATANASYNGVMSVYVLNDLATPNSTVNNDISINVYVSCNDMEVAVPQGFQTRTDTYSATIQAGEPSVDDDSAVDPGCGAPPIPMSFGDALVDDHDALVYFGERVTSFRSLLKRYRFHLNMYVPNPSTTARSVFGCFMPNNPMLQGYNSKSFTVSSTGKKYNYVAPSLEQYVSQAFLAKRGSHRSKYIVTGSPSTVGYLSVTRGINGLSPTAPVLTTLPITTSTYAARRLLRSSGEPGMALTVPARQPILEVELPYYSNLRFQSARLVDYSNPAEENPFSAGHQVEAEIEPGIVPVCIDRYVATGEDYNLVWFQGCPPQYQVVIPTA